MLVDSIYVHALTYYKYDHSEALLAITITCLPVTTFDIQLPIINIPLSLKLPAPEKKYLEKKKRNLPRYFIDSNKTNDIDKLSHFFGNAFWSYNLRNSKFSTILGYVVEYFESIFKVSGALDKRDLYANKLGENFGVSLLFDKNIMPSSYLGKLINYTEDSK